MKFIKNVILSILICTISFLMAEQQDPLDVLFVVDYFPAPGQSFILNIMTGLIDKGHTVSIFAFHRNHKDQSIPQNVEKYSLMDRVIYEEFPEQMPDCSIVFCQSATLGKKILEIDELASWIKARKMVVALRGHDITKNEVKEDPSMYERLFQECDLFLPVCHYFKNVAIQLGCHPDKIIVHHSAIDCSKFFFRKKKHKGKEQIECISVCRLVEKKGLDIAIQAIAQVAKKHKNIHFTIIGRGRLRAPLERLVKKLGLTRIITFFGWATQEQVIEKLDQSHIFLLPSITAVNGDEEGIANALKEAMAMGLISIATRHAGTPELIQDGVSGFLVPENSNYLLAKKIKYVINHPELWSKVSIAARKKIEDEFEIKKMIKELESIFYRLLDADKKNLLPSAGDSF